MKNNTASSARKTGVRDFFGRRNTRRGMTSVSVTVLVIAAAVLINVIFAILSSHRAMYADATADRSFKLRTATLGYLDALDQDVDLYVLANEDDLETTDSVNYPYYVQANRLLHEFEYSSDRIHLHYVDLVKNPAFLSPYKNIDRSVSHMLLVVSGDNYTALDPSDVFSYDTDVYREQGYMVVKSQHVEQSVTSAILKVTDRERITVSVLAGQGEADMSALAARLSMNAYDVETVDLSTGAISDNSEFLVIYKPLSDLDEEIYKRVSDWLDNGGADRRSLIYFPNDDIDTALFPHLNALLADYGMEVEYAYIFEMDDDHLVPGNNLNNSLFDYADADFTKDLSGKSKKIIMGGERGTLSIRLLDDTAASELLVSSDNVMKYDIKTQENGSADGALCGAAIGRKSGTNASVVTVGSFYAVSNLYLTAETYNNAAYFINLFNTLSHKDDVEIIIEGKDPSSAELGVSSVSDLSFLGILVRFILPGLALVAGLVVWFRRRHR